MEGVYVYVGVLYNGKGVYIYTDAITFMLISLKAAKSRKYLRE